MINELLEILSEADKVIEHYQQYNVGLQQISDDLSEIDRLLTVDQAA